MKGALRMGLFGEMVRVRGEGPPLEDGISWTAVGLLGVI